MTPERSIIFAPIWIVSPAICWNMYQTKLRKGMFQMKLNEIDSLTSKIKFDVPFKQDGDEAASGRVYD